MSYNPINWVNGETPINDTNLNNMDQGIADAHSMLAEHESQINEFVNQQLPEEYVKEAVDTYVENNSAGFATAAELEEIESQLDSVNSEVGELSGEIANFEIVNQRRNVNLIDTTKYSANTISGVLFNPVCDDNGNLKYIELSGTAEAEIKYKLVENLSTGMYYVSGVDLGNVNTYQINVRRNYDTIKVLNSGYASFNVSDETNNYNIVFVIRNGVNVDGVKIYPMMWQGDNVLVPYEPYGFTPIQQQIVSIDNSLKPNKPFSPILGCVTHNAESNDYTESSCNRQAKYFSQIMMMNYVGFDDSGNTLMLNDEYEDNVLRAISHHAMTDTIKFHCNPKLAEVVPTFGADCITKYFAYVTEQVNKYKNMGIPLEYVFIFNEDRIYNYVSDETIVNQILDGITQLKTDTGCKVGISFMGYTGLWSANGKFFNACDVVGVNVYPNGGFYGNINVESAINAFNVEYEKSKYWFYRGKPVWVTEFGCSANIDSINTPETGMSGEDYKAQPLFIEGLLRSKFASKIERAYFWYRSVSTYATDTLLSVKNNREVRY